MMMNEMYHQRMEKTNANFYMNRHDLAFRVIRIKFLIEMWNSVKLDLYFCLMKSEQIYHRRNESARMTRHVSRSFSGCSNLIQIELYKSLLCY